jgi:hypothetical protein
MSDHVSKTTNRRPKAQVPLADLPQQLRIDADELSGCGAGNEAEHLRQAADEIEDLRISVISFGAPWMVKYAQDWCMPQGHLDPTHYDILKRAGARMDDFVRGSES